MYPGERFNSISHLFGAVLALAGLALLVGVAAESGNTLRLVAFTVYGTTLFLLYLVSTLYHSVRGRAKSLLRILDHQSIYLLIAGTYPPFALITLNGRLGWWLFGAIWSLALLGLVLDGTKRDGRRILPVVIYLVMGWLALLVLEPLLAVLPKYGFYWLLAGGLCYTAGVAFYVLGHWHPRSHGVWHLFVLAGSVSHYIAILLYV